MNYLTIEPTDYSEGYHVHILCESLDLGRTWYLMELVPCPEKTYGFFDEGIKPKVFDNYVEAAKVADAIRAGEIPVYDHKHRSAVLAYDKGKSGIPKLIF